jgi:acyl dehydratase
MNPEVVGKSYPVQAFRLDAERVAAFAAAVGHPGEGVPPTIVTAPELAAGLANVLGDPDLGLDLAHVVHGEQEYVWGRPPTVGETLTAQASIESVRAKGALTLITLRTEVRDEADRTVAVGRSTLVVRGGS